MRRGHNLTELGERPIRRWLFLENVEAGAGDDPVLDRPSQRGFIDQIASGRINDADARLDARKPRVVEEMVRLRVRRQVEREVIGDGAQIVERQELDAETVGNLARDKWIVRDDLHSERAGARRHFLADASEAGNPQRLPT